MGMPILYINGKKTGERDFEKYSNLVLNDSLDATPLEARDRKIEKND
jgi:cbb3-type cytochrome c oxidase CcoQ subunit